jgi:hypothetical protein
MRLASLPGAIGSFEQRLDHFDTSSTATFPQRYVVNTTFCEGPGPWNCDTNSGIVLYISGEAPMSARRVAAHPLIDLAARTHSLLATLEHRFYGGSVPLDLTTANLSRFLTTDQALADLAGFVDFLRKGNSSRSVIVVGGSYAGTLASYFRQTYPNHANFSWASSPPLHLKLDFTEYDAHCAEVLRNQTDYPRCYENARGLVRYFDDAIANETAFRAARARMGLNRSTDPISLVSIVADQLAGMIQYRSNDGGRALAEFCRNQSGAQPDVESFFEWFRSDNADPDAGDALLLTDAGRAAPAADARAWTWQTCNEYGWFQTASGQLRSRWVNLSYYERICRVLFDDTGAPDQAALARRFGDLRPTATNIVYVNGAIDPWSTLSVPSEGEAPAYNWYSIRIHGGSHCAELGSQTDAPEVVAARERVLETIQGLVNRSTECIVRCAPSQHGHCELGSCMCDTMWGGEWCEDRLVAVIVFQLFAAALVVLPAVMMVVIGCSAWFLFQTEATDGGNVPAIGI